MDSIESLRRGHISRGQSYTHRSDAPLAVRKDASVECVLGIDEAGRGPVLGPMVYGLFYLPKAQHHSLLADKHHFDDSKVLTAAKRLELMRALCDPSSDLHGHCGWATRVMSARDVSCGMLQRRVVYNLNAQAMDATIDLIKGTLAEGVNITEIYVDTIGRPEPYQQKLQKIFPTKKVIVAKKADSLYPCVSAASVCAKVTRDAALDVAYSYNSSSSEGWGSGYPSDSRCSGWLKGNMHPLFGWPSDCRFSWGTAKELLEKKSAGVGVDWPTNERGAGHLVWRGDRLDNWFGGKSGVSRF